MGRHGGSPRNRASAEPTDEVTTRLLTSLNAYLDQRYSPRGNETSAKSNSSDRGFGARLWIFGLLLGTVFTLGTVVPASLLQDELYRNYAEKILTWLAAGGILGRWIQSPAGMVKASEGTGFRVITVAMLLVSLLVFPKLVTIDIEAFPKTATLFQGEQIQPINGPIHERLRFLTYRLQDPDGVKRTFNVSPFEMVKARFHLKVDWRLGYVVTVNCPAEPLACERPNTIEFKLQAGTFDDDSLTRLSNDGFEVVNRNQVRVRFDKADVPEVVRYPFLPAGKYDVTMSVAHCKQVRRSSLDVDGERTYDGAFACPR